MVRMQSLAQVMLEEQIGAPQNHLSHDTGLVARDIRDSSSLPIQSWLPVLGLESVIYIPSGNSEPPQASISLSLLVSPALPTHRNSPRRFQPSSSVGPLAFILERCRGGSVSLTQQKDWVPWGQRWVLFLFILKHRTPLAKSRYSLNVCYWMNKSNKAWAPNSTLGPGFMLIL